MTTIAEQIRIAMKNQAIDVLYTKLELLEEQFESGDLSYMNYSSSKDDIINDIHSILSVYLCPIDLYI